MVRFKTQDLIRARKGTALERGALQAAGDALDEESGGAWIAQDLSQPVAALPHDARILVDAVRRTDQVETLRRAFGQRVVHVHLTAPDDVLAIRYRERNATMTELASYEAVRVNATEAAVGTLAADADIVIDTSRSTPDDVVVRVATQLGYYGRGYDRLVDVVIGGEFGSEGKGQIAAHLAPEYDVLVRVGGPNAGHQVYEEPEVDTFHHLPSGTSRNPTARIVLGAGAVLYLPGLQTEIARH